MNLPANERLQFELLLRRTMEERCGYDNVSLHLSHILLIACSVAEDTQPAFFYFCYGQEQYGNINSNANEYFISQFSAAAYFS